MACHNPAGKPDWTVPPPSGERHDAASQNHALEAHDFVSKGKITFLPLRTEKLQGCSFSEVP